MFESLVTLYRTMEFDAESRTGTFALKDMADRKLLDKLLADDVLEATGLRIEDGDPTTAKVGDKIRLTAGNPKMSYGLLATDMSDLLRRQQELLEEPKRYYVISERYSSTDNELLLPTSISRYRAVLKLLALLEEAAAFLDHRRATLLFLGDDKFEVPVSYTADDLAKIDLPSVERLLRDFSDSNDAHREQKLALLGKSVRATAAGAAPKGRFKSLLEHVSELQKHFSDGYRLFAADFSYDKVVNQIEAAKVEEIGKIHKAFSDIQNQILGIPVATVVVATQMKTATTTAYEFWLNTAVLVGCWVFVVLSALLLRNQLHTLATIESEIDRKKKQILDEYGGVADLVTKSFPDLYGRLRTQRRAMWIVGGILSVGLVLAHVVYFVLTKPAAHWLDESWAGKVWHWLF